VNSGLNTANGLFVSVVIPLYNKKDHVERCVRSVLGQTYQNFEIIVVNDGSTDGGETVVSGIADSRVRLIDQANAGVSVARNRGVASAQSDWIFFLDADDEWQAPLIQDLLDLQARSPEAGVLACPTEKVYSDGRRTTIELVDADFRAGSEYIDNFLATFVRLGESPFSNSSFAVRRKEFLAVGGYAPGVKLTEDSQLWVRLALDSRIAMTRKAQAQYYVEVEGNTRSAGQQDKFAVITALEQAMASGAVPAEWRRSAADLVRLQKLVQLRRHAILGHTRWALQALLDRDLWAHRFSSTLVAGIATLMPRSVFHTIRSLKKLIHR
jgi:GT2 family glycosyltransferase